MIDLDGLQVIGVQKNKPDSDNKSKDYKSNEVSIGLMPTGEDVDELVLEYRVIQLGLANHDDMVMLLEFLTT